MVKSSKFELLGTKDDFNKAKGNISQLEDLKSDLAQKEVVLAKVKKSLVSVVGDAEAVKDDATSGFFQDALKDAKDKKKKIVGASQRVESILEENEDSDGSPVTWALLKATLGNTKRYIYNYVYKHVYVYVYLYKYLYKYVYVCIYMCIYIYICTYIYIYVLGLLGWWGVHVRLSIQS